MSVVPKWMQGAGVAVDAYPTVTLVELCDRIGTELQLTQQSMTRWTVSLPRVETLDGAGLTSEYGDGPTPQAAAEDYAAKLTGKRLVYRAYTPHRVEHGPFVVTAPEDA